MTATPRFYRFRIFDGAGTLADFLDPATATGNLLVATSVRGGTNPYISEEPSGDGQELDPLEGTTTVGAYTVRVLDVETGDASAIAAGDEFDDGAALNTDWPLVPSGAWASVEGVPNTTGRSMRFHADSSATGVGTWTATHTFGTADGLTADTEYVASIVGLMEGIGAPPTVTVDIGSETITITPATTAPQSVRVTTDGAGDLPVTLTITPPGGGYITAVTFDALRIYSVANAPGRLVTRVLADDDAAWRFLSKRAVVEESEDAATWTTLTAGYVNTLRLVDALEWEFTVGDTRRTEQQAELFRYATPPRQTATIRESPACLWGGPLGAGVAFGGTADRAFATQFDYGPARFEVISEANVGAASPQIGLSFVGGRVLPYYTPGETSIDNDEVKYLNEYAADYFEREDGTFALEPGDYGVYGWYPGLVAWCTPVAGGTALEVHPVAQAVRTRESYPLLTGDEPFAPPNQFTRKTEAQLRLRWDTDIYGDALGAKPSVGTQYDVYCYPLRISEAAPWFERGHPVDLLTDKLDRFGIPYSSASATAIKARINAAYGGAVTVELRHTSAQKLTDYKAMLYGALGFAERLNSAGEIEWVGVRYDQPTNAVEITTDLLRDDSGVIWELDESSVVTALDFAADDFDLTRIPDADQSISDYPLSGLRTRTITVEGATDPDAETQDRTYRYALPGRLYVNGFPQSVLALGRDVGAWIVGWRAEGVAETEVACLPAVTAQVGDVVTISAAHRPGASLSTYPRSARGTATSALVVRRTETPGGPDLKLLETPPAEQGVLAPITGTTPADPSDTLTVAFTLARGADPQRLATATLDAPADWTALDAVIAWQITTGASAPTTAGTPVGPIEASAAAVVFPPQVPGATVWVRARAQGPGGAWLTDWSDWESLALLAAAPTVPQPALTWSESAGSVTATATLTAPAVAVRLAAGAVNGAPPALATLQAAPLDSTPPYTASALVTLAAGEWAWVGALAEDADGNESAVVYLRATGPAGGSTGTTVQIVTASLADGATATGTVTVAKTALLQRLVASHACWLRLYETSAARTDDASRAILSDPDAGEGLLSDVRCGTIASVGTWPLTRPITPAHELHNADTPRTATIYYSLTNRSGGAAALTVTLTYLPLES